MQVKWPPLCSGVLWQPGAWMTRESQGHWQSLFLYPRSSIKYRTRVLSCWFHLHCMVETCWRMMYNEIWLAWSWCWKSRNEYKFQTQNARKHIFKLDWSSAPYLIDPWQTNNKEHETQWMSHSLCMTNKRPNQAEKKDSWCRMGLFMEPMMWSCHFIPHHMELWER